MKKDRLDAIIMTDLHWGAIEPKRFEFELQKCLFNRLNHIKELDAIIISGDLFDMKEYSSSETFRSVLLFINELILATEKLNSQIIILKGTRTHDDLQLQTLEVIYKDIPRVRFIHTVAEDVINGISLLYIPEEYVVDQELYYKDWFGKHYDIVIGHGMIDKIWYAKKGKRDDISSAPVFDVEKICKVGNYCYFGHVHEHKAYGENKRFKYVGPVTRWEYDKPWDCGYYIVSYDKVTEFMEEEFVVNEYAQILKTFAISVDNDTNMDELIEKVQSYLDDDSYDGLKLIVRMKSTSPVYIQAKNYLITKVGLYDKVRLSVITDDDDEEETEEEKIVKEKTEELHDTLFTNTLDDEVTIHEFIRNKEGKNIPLNRIKEVCGIT